MTIKVVIYPGPSIRNARYDLGLVGEQITAPCNFTWSIGQENPILSDINGLHTKTKDKDKDGGFSPFTFFLNSEQVFLTASGKELDIIRTHMCNLPFPVNGKNFVMWEGEMAKFIILNFTW